MDVKKLRGLTKKFAGYYFNALMKKKTPIFGKNSSKDIYSSDTEIVENDDLDDLYVGVEADHLYMVKVKENYIVFFTDNLYLWYYKESEAEIIQSLITHGDTWIMIPASLSAEEIKAAVIRYVADTAFMQYIDSIAEFDTEDDDDEDDAEIDEEDDNEELDKEVEDFIAKKENENKN